MTVDRMTARSRLAASERPVAAWIGRSAIAAALVAAVLVGAACGGARRAPAVAPATEAILSRARAEERARRYDSARELYLRAARQAPDPTSGAHAWHELGAALAFWGETRDAEVALRRSVALAPAEPRGWHDLGVVRARLGDTTGAERALGRAIRLAPADPRPRIALAAMLVQERRWDAALDQYRSLARLELPERIRRAVARAIGLVEAEQRRERPPRPALY